VCYEDITDIIRRIEITGVFLQLRAVTQDGGTIADQQEVDSRSHNHEISRRARRDHASRVVLEVQLASTRNVQVAARLVHVGVQAQSDEVRANILGRGHVAAAIRVRQVSVVEHTRERLVDIDTMSGHFKRVDRGHVTVNFHLGRSALQRRLSVVCSRGSGLDGGVHILSSRAGNTGSRESRGKQVVGDLRGAGERGVISELVGGRIAETQIRNQQERADFSGGSAVNLG